MNRLSVQTKDATVRALKGIFDANSISVANAVLKDCVMAACSNPSQMMTTLIPIYAAIVAALHAVVGTEVGAFVTEVVANSLYTAIVENRSLQRERLSKDDPHVASKVSNNALLLLVYLYNLRVVHHTLIVDIMNVLAGSFAGLPWREEHVQHEQDYPESTTIRELEVELLVCIVEHCGPQLRTDDPLGIKNAMLKLNKRASATTQSSSSPTDAVSSGRLRFMLEAFADLKNNKSRRAQSSNTEAVTSLRKWLGTVKNSVGSARGGADQCLRVTLADLLDADKRGRWWRAGASWTGKSVNDDDSCAAEGREGPQRDGIRSKCAEKTEEETRLLALAKKMRFNTATRQNIFVVIASSRDVDDAFERLQRLGLKGKQDREVVRVVSECCAQEKTYNAFYSELASLLCTHNRQCKTTIQFTFWDNFKMLADEDSISSRRVVNLARFLAHLVCAFHLPLAVLKPIDMMNLNANMILFSATFFMSLFAAKVCDVFAMCPYFRTCFSRCPSNHSHTHMSLPDYRRDISNCV